MSYLQPSLYHERLEDGNIVLFQPKNVLGSVLIRWAEEVVSTLRHWPEDRPYLAIHDLSAPGVALLYAIPNRFDVFNPGVTSEGREQVNAILQARSGLNIRLAIVVSSYHSGKLVAQRSRQTKDLERLQTNLFFDRGTAITWLKGSSPETKPSE